MRSEHRLLAAVLWCACWWDTSAATVDVPVSNHASYAVHVSSLAELRFRQVVHQSMDFSCGSAAVATLLSYHYHDPVSESEVLQAMYAVGDQAKIRREGFSLLDIKSFLVRRGYAADGYRVPLERLSEKHTPAIVLVRDKGYNHFVVVKGLRQSRVLIGDPALGMRTMAAADFMKIWTNGMVFVIHGTDGEFDRVEDWRTRPSPTLADALDRNSLLTVTLMRRPANEF